MTEALSLLLAFLIGLLAGVFFFGGLWWTVKRSLTVRQPHLFLFQSFVLRSGVVLLALYLCTATEFPRIISYMFGFLLTRHLVLRRLRITPAGQPERRLL
jgi:F1F0 ATPase subunit 2